jgi:superoxide dismutase, Cu-Zn family
VGWETAGGKMSLKDADGSSLVIHANADDGLTQPIGGAGDRVACAVIK